MAFNLGGLASGLSSGMQSGADLKAKAMQLKMYQQQLDQEKQKLVAQTQAGAAGMNGIGGDPSKSPGVGAAPPPPMAGGPGGPAPQPGGPPPPSQPPQPGGAPPMLPGASPMPGVGPQAAPPPGGGAPPPGGGAPPPGGGAPPQPGGGAPPAGPPMSGVAKPTGNYSQDQAKTLQSLYSSVKQSNPNIKPGEAFRAVELLVGQMKGVSAEDKIALQAQNDIMRINFQYTQEADRHQDAEGKLQAMVDTTRAKLEAAEKRNQELIDAKHQDTETTVAGRDQVAGISAGSRERVGAGHDAASVANAGTRAGASIAVGAGHDQSGVQREGMRGGAARDVAETNRRGRVGAAAITAGQPDTSGGGAAPKAPPVGTVRKGYRFKGGDPSNATSWTKVQ